MKALMVAALAATLIAPRAGAGEVAPGEAEAFCRLAVSMAVRAAGERYWDDKLVQIKWSPENGLAKFQYQLGRGLNCKVIFENGAMTYGSVVDADGNYLVEKRF